MSQDDDSWGRAAHEQEQEQKRQIIDKMAQMELRKSQKNSNSGASATSDESQSTGWPNLPPQNENGNENNWGSSSNEQRSPTADLVGVGRGKPFTYRQGDQSNSPSSFADLGGGGRNIQSFGQFGTFSSTGTTQQQTYGDQGNRTNKPPSMPPSNYSFKTSSADSGFGSSGGTASHTGNFDSKSYGGGGGGSSNRGGGPNNGASSFDGDRGDSARGNNWPSEANDQGGTKSPSSNGWPNLDEPSSNQQRHGDRTGHNNSASAIAASVAAAAGGGTSTIGRLQEENWDEEVPEKPLTNIEMSHLNKMLHQKLVNNKYDVKIERQNPNNPLFSVKSFEELRLSEELLSGVYEMGFSYPSKIQESALPALLANPPQNMIAQSQSGTGKTAAFVLTMLSRVDPELQYPQCLCLSPSYELALQTGQVLEKMGKYMTNVKVAYAVRGGLRIERGSKLDAQIIIGTPGTVLDWILKFRCFDPKLLTVFVLDEADLMISLQGHQDQSIRIHKQLSPTCQHLLFSATYDDQVMEFAFKIVSDPVVIRLRREEETLDYIKQYYVNCRTRDDKYQALRNVYGTLTIGQAVIFCRTRKEASWLAGKLTEDGHLVGLLSGELDITQRAAVIDRFKKGSEKVLISTNLSARGIDVEQVSIVINYDLPTTQDMKPDYETYLHRIGRTGRFGKAGVAINFIDSNWSKTVLEQIESHFGRSITPLNTDDMDALEKIENNAD